MQFLYILNTSLRLQITEVYRALVTPSRLVELGTQIQMTRLAQFLSTKSVSSTNPDDITGNSTILAI